MARERPERQLFWMVAVSGGVLLALWPLFGPLIRDLPPIHIAGLAVPVIVVSAGFIFWLWLFSVYPAPRSRAFPS